ncbi:MAG TPA: AAA family ATPase [Candidatus Paceibacterota bacterium]|nr:AAA family ATPase [Candidatus Paceibacterota bacterium]
MNLVLVVGISGVGKTTLCAAYAARRPEICHLTASYLIARRLKTTVQNLRDMKVRSELLSNQRALAEELQYERRKIGRRPVLLDGQCVLDTGAKLIVLPPDELMVLGPTALMLLELDVDELLRRRSADNKKRPSRTAAELEIQMAVNHEAVSRYGLRLGVPVKIVRAEAAQFSPAADELFEMRR